ncbi:MAG: hypothetical protein P8165_17620 [Deltaproteobacteria bacterium]
MDPVWERDLKQVFGDTKALEHGFEVLEEDHAKWNSDGEQKDLMNILERAQRLESDVTILMSDCFRLAQKKSNNGIKNDLRNAFRGLDVLFEDLKTLRTDLDQSYAKSDALTQLEIDWARFRKTLRQIQRDLAQEEYAS